MWETQGGSIFFGLGALGGSLVGVHFLTIGLSAEDVRQVVEATRAGVGVRHYGGHILVMAGAVGGFPAQP